MNLVLMAAERKKNSDIGHPPLKAPLSKPLNLTIKPDKQATGAKTFYHTPNTGASLLLSNVINSGDEIRTLPARKNRINSKNNYKLYTDGDAIYVSKEQGSEILTAKIPNFSLFGSPRARMGIVFDYIVLKINEIAITNRKYNGYNIIDFPIQELVDSGIYTTRKSAMQGIQAVCNALSGATFSTEKKKKGQKSPKSFSYEPLFYKLSAEDKSNVHIELNPNFPWEVYYKFYSILPLYYFKLSKKARALLQYIFSYARMQLPHWVDRKYFTLSFRNIQSEMALPHESEVKKPARDIMQVILNAIDEISEYHNESLHNSNLLLTPMPEDLPTRVKPFLDNGYLKVEISGDWLDYFKRIHNKQKRKIEQDTKRTERAKEKALTKKMLNDIKDDHKDDYHN